MNLVSVIMPAYNSEKTISKSILSVLSQSYKNIELIICNDFSNDNTQNILNKFLEKDKRVKVINNSQNYGPGVSRNNALKISKGLYIAFLDSDDEWPANKLEKQICFMKKNKIDLCHTNLIEVHSNKKKYRNHKSVVEFKDMLIKNFLATSTVIINKKMIKYLFVEMRKRQDYVFWLQNMQNGLKSVLLNEYLCFYSIRKNSISNSNKFAHPIYHFKIFYKYMKFSLVKSLIFWFRNIISQSIKIYD